MPDTIEDAVLARLRHRSPEAQQVARAGAIIGRCFVPEVLAGIMDVPPEALDAPLQELIDNYVLEPPGARGLYDFRHQLLRDAIYRSVPVGDRRRFHARAGEFGAQLEGQSGDPFLAALRTGWSSTPGLRDRAVAAPATRHACPPTASRSSCIAGPSTTCRPTSILPSEAPSWTTAANEAAQRRGPRDGRRAGARGRARHTARPAIPSRRSARCMLVINIDRRECGPTSERLATLRCARA